MAPIGAASPGAGDRPRFGPVRPVPGARDAGPAAPQRHCCGASIGDKMSRFSLAIGARPGISWPLVLARAGDGTRHLAVEHEVLCALAGPGALAAVVRRHRVDVRTRIPERAVYALRRPGTPAGELARERAGDPDVRHAAPNWVARAQAVPNDPLFAAQSEAAAGLRLDEAWDLSTGQGVTVAVLDSGLDAQHPDLQGAVAGWLDPLTQSAQPFDDNGHGTAVAGIIAARKNDRFGIAGVAPEAQVLAIKVADKNGSASFADMIWGLDHAAARAARVICIPYGATIGDPLLQAAVQRALDAGAVVIASAGNENLDQLAWPAAYPGVVAVGCAGPHHGLGFSTALSPGLKLLAPAETIPVPLPGGVHGFAGGTSAAAGFAAGAAALALSRSRAVGVGLDRLGLARVLQEGTVDVPSLQGLEEAFDARSLDARRVVERADRRAADLAVRRLLVLPLVPAPEALAVVRAEVRNEGQTACDGVRVVARARLQGTWTRIGETVIPHLGPGRALPLAFDWTAPAQAGAVPVEVAVDPVPAELETLDNAAQQTVTVAAGAPRDLAFARLDAWVDHTAGEVVVNLVLRNLGPQDEPARVDVRVSGAPVAQWTGTIPVRQDAKAVLRWPLAPQGAAILELEATLTATRGGERRLSDNRAGARVRVLGQTPKPLNALFQQSLGVDLAADAPFRIGGSRTYVPVLFFAPNKGSSDTQTGLWLDDVRVEVAASPQPGAPKTTIFRDKTGDPPSVTSPGLELLDELGQAQPGLELFDDRPLTLNGRHAVLRVPRALSPVQPGVGQPADVFFDVTMDWRFRRTILFFQVTTRRGTHRRQLKVTLGVDDLPELPGENQYYDAHHHTIAEWYFATPQNLFSPRKAYGGPLVMVNEAAYVTGMIPSPQAVRDRVIVTDHNVFYNEAVGDPNGWSLRPPFGLSSPAASPAPGGGVLPEAARYREIYGLAAAEEVAVAHNQLVTTVGPIPLAIPLGTHMLTYRANHVEGPWHGGGLFDDPAAPPGSRVDLDPLLRQIAQDPQQPAAFCFAAHPQSSMLGWDDAQLELALGLNPAARTTDRVRSQPGGFVFKGLQIWNGRDEHRLPSSGVDFRDLAPYSDAQWQRSRLWQGSVLSALVRWHDAISTDLLYSVDTRPDRLFPRKVLAVAGTDAHGDFNFGPGRLAAPLPIPSTYSLGSTAFGSVRTYVFTEGVAGPTPGERKMRAFAGGRSVMTDGPLVRLALDAEGRFDGAALRWHDGQDLAEDDDGRMGGTGDFDGGGTMLCVRQNPHVWIRYRYENISEFGSQQGAIGFVKIYKDTPTLPNPHATRSGRVAPLSVGSLATTGAGQDLAEPLNPQEEGLISEPSAISIAAYTGTDDPDLGPIDPSERRAYTNPVWAMPIDLTVQATPTAAVIPAGALRIDLELPMSMDPGPVTFEVKPLDANGDSTSSADPALATLQGTWSAGAGGVESAHLTLTNPQAIPTTGDPYPQAGRKTFVGYFRTPPSDVHGNVLNPLAFTFEVAGGQPPGSVTSPSQGGARTSGAGGGGGGGGCAFDLARRGPSSWLVWVVLAALLAGVSARTRRRVRDRGRPVS